MNKYLLLGSGPNVADWYAEYGDHFLRCGYWLVAINNAWRIDPKKLRIWMRSTDFLDIGNEGPGTKIAKRIIDPVRDREWERWKNPFDYDRKEAGTMFLNACYYLINRSYEVGKSCIILTAGCNMHYPSGKSHFYGNGTPDPLRLGEDYLLEQTRLLKDFTDKGWYQIYNVSLDRETLLPFNRIHPSVIGAL